MQNEKEFTQICKEILALSEKVKELNLARLETISVEIKLAKNSFDDKSGEMDAKIAEFGKIAERLEPLKESIAKAEELIAKIKEGGAGGVSEEKTKQLINEAVDGLASAVEELKQKTPIDDAAAAVDKTYSSRKIEDTFAKKGETSGSIDVSGLATKEELGAKIDEMKANELIAAKTATLATKDELYDKLTTTIYESDKATFALKSQLNAYVTTSSLGNYLTRGQLDNALNKYTKAQTVASNTIDFMQGVNFTGSVSGQITAGDREAGQSGLVYISGGVSGFSSDFVILNPSEATYGQGYVFFSYFVRPGDNKVLISFIKAA
ncbi:hypothetical protein [Campylobacter showae]|uniref:hypothetical protein n=1 Tax=Campylobacter showae TaxID=204 RepID=UPI000F08CD16|nr:hypothetical protein [Campylobacter showae]